VTGGEGFETRAIHAGQEADLTTGAVVPPIYQTSTYLQDGVGKARGGHDYSRSINPTRTALERCVADLEGGVRGLAFASGMAASDTVLRALLAPGDHAVFPNDAYGGTYRLFARVLSRWGVESTAVPMHDDAALRAALIPGRTKLLWIETPTNPMLNVADIAGLSTVAHAAGALVVVDNTFASPYLQQPLALGADVVVHSTTKYMGGHSDVVGGAVVAKSADVAELIYFHQNAMGSVAGPFDAWLVLRGIKTLAVRMERHCDNAERMCDLLSGHPAVTQVLYPGLSSHVNHDVAQRQMRRFGGMISFRVHGGRERAVAVCERTRVITLGESLGGVESLIELPSEMTHQSVVGSSNEVPDDLIRLSVGIEAIDDLDADLSHALS
jgi:cystathionine gamma-synthase